VKGVLPVLLMAVLCLLPLQAQIMEDFDSLDRWEPLTFRKIDRYSRYDLTIEDGKSVVRARADSSASGLIFKERFSVAETPVVE
jgi:hypothetical protein